jgi:hypothetical protein
MERPTARRDAGVALRATSRRDCAAATMSWDRLVANDADQAVLCQVLGAAGLPLGGWALHLSRRAGGAISSRTRKNPEAITSTSNSAMRSMRRDSDVIHSASSRSAS